MCFFIIQEILPGYATSAYLLYSLLCAGINVHERCYSAGPSVGEYLTSHRLETNILRSN